jgi:hypothetical protein
VGLPLWEYPIKVVSFTDALAKGDRRLPTATRSGMKRSPKHNTSREVIVPTLSSMRLGIARLVGTDSRSKESDSLGLRWSCIVNARTFTVDYLIFLRHKALESRTDLTIEQQQYNFLPYILRSIYNSNFVRLRAFYTYLNCQVSVRSVCFS